MFEMPNFSNLPTTSNPNLEITMINEHFSSDPQIPQNPNPNPTNLKSPHPRTPTLPDTNDNPPPKKKFNMMQDPNYLSSGHLPPVLHQLNTPSKLAQVPVDFIYDNPDFKHNLPKNYMVPTNYKFKVTTLEHDHYVQYSSKNNEKHNF